MSIRTVLSFRSILLVCVLSLPATQTVAAEFQLPQLQDGDRVVLLGNTLIERSQNYGYWEAALQQACAGKQVVFRNLGWSGDTVFGEARAGFGTPADGFKNLSEHIISLKPTVILLGYGTNAAFKGEAGLPEFLQGLDVLLGVLESTKARIVILSPIRQENLGAPLPNPTRQNQNLEIYTAALQKVAQQRGYGFADLFHHLGEAGNTTPEYPLTDNGLHLTAYGYWKSADVLTHLLGAAERTNWSVELTADGKLQQTQGTQVSQMNASTNRILFECLDHQLPRPLPPADASVSPDDLQAVRRQLKVDGLAPGQYKLTIDGQLVATASTADWARGVNLSGGPEFDQVEQLRQTIRRKNRLYFYRWRPQNITYLFGFRKHEQGNNAVEIPQFDPLVAEQETAIAKLVAPVAHKYVLTRVPTQP